jgi:hypothetical protein
MEVKRRNRVDYIRTLSGFSTTRRVEKKGVPIGGYSLPIEGFFTSMEVKIKGVD